MTSVHLSLLYLMWLFDVGSFFTDVVLVLRLLFDFMLFCMSFHIPGPCLKEVFSL